MSMNPADILLPYQKFHIKDRLSKAVREFVIVEKARRTGITFAEACWTIRRRLCLKEDHWFSSADERTAKEFIGYCVQWAKIFNLFIPAEAQINIEGATTESLIMPNGSKIVAVSSNPKALRGKGGSITLDEFAFHEKQEELYKAAQAVNQWGGHLRLISTHNGPATMFAEICKTANKPVTFGNNHGRSNWRHQKIDIYAAVAQGLAEKIPGNHHSLATKEERGAALIEDIKANCLTEDIFLQEFCCVPMKLQALISADEYEKLVIGPVPSEINPSHNYNRLFVGIDVGRTKDLTVIWVLEEGFDPSAKTEALKRVFRTVCVKAMKNVPFPVQFQTIKQIVSHPAVERCMIDMGSVGRQLADDLYEQFGDIVMPVGMTSQRKAILAESLKRYVSYELISLPPDEIVKNDFCSLARTASKNGNLSYDGQTTESHCDYFWGCGLAIGAAQEDQSVSFTSLRDLNRQTTGSR